MTKDYNVQRRKMELIEDANIIINGIKSLDPNGTDPPLIDPSILAKAVNVGLLNAPPI